MSLCREHWAYHSGGLLSEPFKLIFQLAKTRPGQDARYAGFCDALPTAAEVVYLYWRTGAKHPG